MAFDKEAFRRKAQAKAIRERVQKVRSRVQEEEVAVDDADLDNENLSLEEKKVLEQYRQWKATRESVAKKPAKKAEGKTEDKTRSRSAALREKIARRIRENEQVPADGPTGDEASAVDTSMPKEDKVGTGKTITQKQLEARRERVAKLRRKLEKRARIAKIKDRIAERREAANDTESSTKIREEAQALKKRIARVRKMIENDMMQQQPQQPMDAQSQMMDPNAGMDMGMDAGVQLPPEVVAEIQNISSAAQNLASLAGVGAEDALGADAEAGIGAEMDAGVEGMEQEMQQQPVLENKMTANRRKKVLEAIKRRRESLGDNEQYAGKETVEVADAKEGDGHGSNREDIVEATRSKVQARREALKKLRAQALKEDYKSEGAEESTSQIKSEVDAYMGNNHNDPKQVIHQQGRKIDGPSPSMPGSKKLKPAKTWPTKPAKSGKFESEDVEPEDGQEELVEGEMGWDESHIDRYLERKELSFKDMISKGLLG